MHKLAKVVILMVFLLISVGILSSYAIAYRASAEDKVITIESKERITTGHGKNVRGKWLVFTNEGPFEVTDTLVFGRWDSSNRYHRLKKGKTYKVTVAGWRWGFRSMYKNIIEIRGEVR